MSTYQLILNAIQTGNYADRDAVLTTIDVAFENDDITQYEARRLEAALG